MKAAPVIVVVVLGLLTVIVICDGTLSCTEVGLKAFVITGGATTVRYTVLLGLPAVPVWVEVTPVAVLACTPPVLLVTLTEIAQLPLAARLPPLRLMLPLPAAAVTVPPQLLLTDGVAATCILLSVSLKATPVRAAAVGLLSVKVMVDVPPLSIDVGAKALAMVGLPTASTAAVAAGPLPPLLEVTAEVVLL